MSSPATSTKSDATRTAVEVRMEGLSRHYGSVVALDNLDLTVQPGELIALLDRVVELSLSKLHIGERGLIDLLERSHGVLKIVNGALRFEELAALLRRMGLS